MVIAWGLLIQSMNELNGSIIPMETRKLGRLQHDVTRIGYGMAAVGRPAYINIGHERDIRKTDVDALREQAFKVLDFAWENHIRYFDVARSYGRAEEFLAAWLESRTVSPDEVTVGSKWGYTYTGNWRLKARTHEVKDHSWETLTRQWTESSYNLGRYLDLYQIHSATEESGVLEDEKVIDRLWEIREHGTTIGLTLSGSHQSNTLYRAFEIQRDGVQLFESVQATWNLLEQSATDALVEAQNAGWLVIIKEALANGRLTTRNASTRSFSDSYAVLSEQASRLDTTIDALGLRYVLERPWADVILSGVSRKRHLRANLKAFDIAWDNEADDALSALVENPVEYWDTRANLKWT